MKIILATQNSSKAEQIKDVFRGVRVSILTLGEAGIPKPPADIEDGQTLQRNALIKARYASEYAPGSWTMADDTGIFIRALGGEPGVKSARWLSETASTEETMHHCLKRLEGISNRSAYFRTAVALISPVGINYFFEGMVEGRILEYPTAEPQPNMPYSPLFQPKGYDKTWAQMPIEEENRISHRGQAFSQARGFLEYFIL